MKGRAIIIADADTRYLHQMANHFGQAGYQVATAESAEKALNLVLEDRGPVLLLSSNLGLSNSLANLVELLKICNRNLRIIMVSDDLSLAETRRLRETGIFYHALKPAAGDLEELGQVVACAFGERPVAPALLEVAAAPEAQPLARVLPLIVGVLALVFGAGIASLSLLEQPIQGNSSLAIWIFLGFVALIVTNQVLPIFRIKLLLKTVRNWQAARGAHRSGE